MAVIIHCPQCAKKLYVPAKKVGDDVTCPNCSSSFLLPVRAEAAEVLAADPLGHNPSPLGMNAYVAPQHESNRSPNVSAWMINPETVQAAEGMIRQSAILFYVVAGLLAVASLLIGIATLLDALLIAGLALWLHRAHARIPATLLLILAAISVVTTTMNKVGGGEGGRNLLVSAMFLWGSIRAQGRSTSNRFAPKGCEKAVGCARGIAAAKNDPWR